MLDCAVVSTMSNMSSNTPKKKMFIECIRFLFPTKQSNIDLLSFIKITN